MKEEYLETNPFERFSNLKLREEETAYRFKVITQITVEDVLEFYRALARFPTNDEVILIKDRGVYHVINSLTLKEHQKV